MEDKTTEGPDIAGILEQFPWVMIPVGLILLWIGVGQLWNNKIRSIRSEQGIPTASFNNVLGRVLRFVFKEDKYPVYIKNEKGEPTNVLKYPRWGKHLVWRNFYFLGFASSFILAIAGNTGAPWILVSTVLIIATRTSKVFSDRHRVLIRMFEVAASEMGYAREANLNPWGWVQIREWDRLTIPGETNVMFPNKYKSEELKNRENFERHFNGTVTEDNTWLYHWKSSKSMVICSPVTHIPEFSPYPGSQKGEWNKIPLGVGTEGEVFWDVALAPMSLITGTTGGGKDLSLSISVETTSGKKKVGDLKVGDTLFDPEGMPTKVMHLHPIITPAKAYELTFSNGEKIIANPDHLWETETREARLSRFNGVKKEVKRSRQHWLDKTVREAVEATYEASTNEDTISIKEVSELTKKHATTNIFHDIAKEIGVAEEATPQITLYHKATIMKQMQTLLYANSAQLMTVYNSRKNGPTKKTPLTRNQWDKLRQLLTEVRESDILTVDSMVEYLGGNKFTEEWVRENFDTTLGTQESIKDLSTKGASVKSNLPDKIFSIDAEYVNARQLASLLGVDFNRDFAQFFVSLCRKVEDTFKKKEEVELVRPERTTVQKGGRYFTYPKKMFLDRILRHDETPMNDQRSKRLTPEIRTTQEIFDTLKTTGATIYTNHSIRKAKALQMPEANLPIMPYVLGAWLGDGFSHKGSVCGIDAQLFERFIELGYIPTDQSKLAKFREGMHEDFQTLYYPLLNSQLSSSGILSARGYSVRKDGSTKHIPAAYFSSSIEQRRELLRGLLDTDGSVKDNGAVQFYTSVPQLRDDAKRLIAGLGYIPFVSEKQPTYTHNGETLTSETTAYTITFQADPADRLFGIDRKNTVHAERFNTNNVHSTVDVHYIVDIKEVAPEPMRCISVDSPSRLFLVGESMIATHNSTIQRNIIFHCIQHPDRWRFLGIDVKRVELSPYAKYEPVVMGIALDVPDGVEIIRYAKEEMEKRYTKMQEHGVNHFKDLPEKMHALMVMVDETYMFLAPSGIKTDEGKEEDALKGEASKLIGDIARLGRAAGVHMVLATQRPDATVIYGELKQNLACRVAAGKADTIASQMTLDNDNATRLPGHIKGRGYVQNFGTGEQFQGYFAPQHWIDKHLAGEGEWLQFWAEEGQDLDQVQLTEQNAPSTKKSKKPKFGKVKNDDTVIEGEFEEPKDKPAKKKGGFLGKINEFNERQSQGASPEAAEAPETTPEPTEEFSFDKEPEQSAEPLLTADEDNSNAKLNKLAKEIKQASANPVSEDPFTDLADPFTDFADLDEPFAELDEGPSDLGSANTEFEFSMGSNDLFSGTADDEFSFTVDESVFAGVPETSEVKEDAFDFGEENDDPFAFLGMDEAEKKAPEVKKKEAPVAEKKVEAKKEAPAVPKPVAKKEAPVVEKKVVAKSVPVAAPEPRKIAAPAVRPPAPRSTAAPSLPLAPRTVERKAPSTLPARPSKLPPRPTR